MGETIDAVEAWEVLDSRGEPTIRVAVEAGDARGTFTVPSGASTGTYEAVERRDGGDRYAGLGVRDAVAAVEDELGPAVLGHRVADQRTIDETLVTCDGTDELARCGANAVLGVSGGVLHAASAVEDRPLYDTLADRATAPPGTAPTLPLPMVNLLSGGRHAEGGMDVQDVLAVPTAATTLEEAIETAWAVRRALRDRIVADGQRPLVADEGGFSPSVDSVEDAFRLVVDAIETAGFEPGNEVALAVDVAAVQFYDPDRGHYDLHSADAALTREEMIERVCEWVTEYPIRSIEDPLDEDDWAGWSTIAGRLPDAVQLLGDDLLVTNEDRLETANDHSAADAILIKPNQAGTMTRVFDVVRAAVDAGVAPVVSARSGETCDATIADLATGLDAGQIKIGSLARSERLAKYNRLLGIAADDDLTLAESRLRR
jgi:enolase